MDKTVPADAILIPEQAEKVFSGKIFDVYQWPQKMFDGSTATFEMLRRPDTVIFLAITGDKIIFIREQQPGRAEYTRLPGGRVDLGEDWLTAVKRECAEEIGMTFDQWRLVNVRQPVAKIEWFVATYIATGLTAEQAVEHDAGERITSVPMTFEEAKTCVADAANPLNGYYALFENAVSLDDLRALPEFRGKKVNTRA